MDKEEPEESRDGFVKIPVESWDEIEKLADGYIRTLPFETVYEFVKRFHLYLIAQMYMDRKNQYNHMKEDLKRYLEPTNSDNPYVNCSDITKALINQLDAMMGFETLGDEDMDRLYPKDKLPDSDFFKNLGLE